MKRWLVPALEALVAFAAPALLVASCMLIRVNPRDRLGQISGLAGIELRFFLFAIVLVVALLIAARVRGGRGFDTTSRLVCAAVAGLATGVIAAGVLVALRGTPYGLHTKGGDVTAILSWVDKLRAGESIPPMYPPGWVHMLRGWSDITGLPAEHAVKQLQIAGTLAVGPVAYLSWRLLLRPGWAVGIAVVASLPFVEPYKPYPNLVLVMFVPLALVFLRELRDIEKRTWGGLLKVGIAIGATFGLACLLYSGWFKWAAPGLFVAVLAVFPWRTARKPALAFLAVTGAAFLLVAGRFIFAVLFNPDAAIVDTFIYFDVTVEPMYIAMWKNDLQGLVYTWPPPGELGGVGLFTILLVVGLGLAIAYGRGSSHVLALVLMMVGAWLLRFMHARLLWETKLVQLYPRTTAIILYCLLVLAGLAVYWIVERRPTDHPLRGRTAHIGAIVALLLLFASAGSSTSDRYMPSETIPPGPGLLATTAHQAHRLSRGKIIKPRVLYWTRRPIAPVPTGVPQP